MSELKAVIFDWDGVLVPLRVDLRPVFKYITDKIVEFDLKLNLDINNFVSIEELIKSAKKDLAGQNIPEDFFDNLKKEILDLINEIFTKDALTNSLSQMVLQTLRKIRELGLKLGIFTINRFHIVDKILKNSNATHFFNAIVTQDDVKLNIDKIDKAEHLKICLERLCVSGHECIVIGDRPVDILPAYLAKAITIGILNHDNRHRMKAILDKLNYTIQSIDEIYQIITTLIEQKTA
jgi:phosphoglycolate phosphatase-like HAD superfamily hydrolase